LEGQLNIRHLLFLVLDQCFNGHTHVVLFAVNNLQSEYFFLINFVAIKFSINQLSYHYCVIILCRMRTNHLYIAVFNEYFVQFGDAIDGNQAIDVGGIRLIQSWR
jgi:hypothetical protein